MRSVTDHSGITIGSRPSDAMRAVGQAAQVC
jgi:hypothetical protein